MSEQTVSKFRCEAVTHTQSGGEVKLHPVTGHSNENKGFFKYTPYGEIKMGILSEGSLGLFVPGQEYYVTFRKAD